LAGITGRVTAVERLTNFGAVAEAAVVGTVGIIGNIAAKACAAAVIAASNRIVAIGINQTINTFGVGLVT